MACDQSTMELLSTYVDGEATPEEAARARAHLDTCTECREMVQEWRRGLEMLDWTYAHALPEGIEDLSFQPPAPPERSRGWSFSLPNLRVLAVAAVLALIALTGLHVYQTVTYLPTLGQSLSTAQKARTVLVAKGVRLEILPDTEISRLGERAVRLVRGTIRAEVTGGRGFTVHTRELEIIDRGTRFEVHSDSTTDRVTVTEGSVLVRKGEDEYHVSAGEMLTSTKAGGNSKTEVVGNGGSSMPVEPQGGVNVGFIPIIVLTILAIVFWVKMLVDALTRQFPDNGSKIAWVLVIIFLQLLGALIYWAVVYVKDRPARPNRSVRVGQNGNNGIIPRLRVLVAALLLTMVFGFGVAVSLVARGHTGNLALLAYAVSVIGSILWTAYQMRKLPISTLADLEALSNLHGMIHPKSIPVLTSVTRYGDKRVIMWRGVLQNVSVHCIGYALFGIVLGLLIDEPTNVAWISVGAASALGGLFRDLRRPIDQLRSLDDGTPTQ